MSSYEVISFKNDTHQTQLDLIPEFGGRLNRLILNSNGKSFDLIQESEPNADLSEVTRFNAVPLFPFPNRLDNGTWNFNGQDLAFPINEPENENALHGFLYFSAFEITETENNEEGIHIRMLHSYDGSRSYYPFPFEITQDYMLSGRDRLSLKMSFCNKSDQEVPLGFGWHPYFRFDCDVDDLILQMPVTEEILVDERQLPTGETVPETYFSKGNIIGDRFLDTCFRTIQYGSSETFIRDKNESFEFKIYQSQIFKYLQVFTKPHRKTIAIEPVTSNINMLQNHEHEVMIKPDETISGIIEICIKQLS